jgi:hypothetical protein
MRLGSWCLRCGKDDWYVNKRQGGRQDHRCRPCRNERDRLRAAGRGPGALRRRRRAAAERWREYWASKA